MHCSSCERALDAYLEGELSARKTAQVREHLGRCAGCQALFEELRVVDGLLATARHIEPVPNFTFATMAEVRGMPQPHVARTRLLAFIGAYLAAVWAVLGLWILFNNASARAAFSMVAGIAAHGVSATSLAATGLSRALAHGSPVTTVFIGALVLDIALALAFFIVYGVVRPHLAARLAHVREVV